MYAYIMRQKSSHFTAVARAVPFRSFPVFFPLVKFPVVFRSVVSVVTGLCKRAWYENELARNTLALSIARHTS